MPTNIFVKLYCACQHVCLACMQYMHLHFTGITGSLEYLSNFTSFMRIFRVSYNIIETRINTSTVEKCTKKSN